MEQNTTPNPEKKKLIKTIVIAAVAVVCVSAIAVTSVLLINGKKKEQLRSDELTAYVNVARNLASSNTELSRRTFADAGEALEAFTAEFNQKSDGKTIISYKPGNSYATGKTDPWGTPYYITAKRDYNEDLSTYSFYVTSAGKNKEFNEKTMLLDKDDLSSILMHGTGTPTNDTIANSNNNTEDFGLNKILADKISEQQKQDALNQVEQNTQKEEEKALPKHVTLTLNTQTGNNGGTIRIKNGQPMNTYSVSVPTRENYEFMGYYTETLAGGIKYFNDRGIGVGTAEFTENTVLYAAWKGEIVTYTLNSQGGTTTVATTTAKYGHNLSNITAPVKNGYSFQGYFEQIGGAGKQYYDKNGKGLVKCEDNNDKTLYAHWTADSFTVEHYVMGTDGKYPATPQYKKQLSNPLNMTFNANDLIDNSLIIPNGIVYDKTTVDGGNASALVIDKANIVVRIYYKRCEYDLTLTNDTGVKSVTGDGSYYYDQRVTINAEMESGYEWMCWRDLDTPYVIYNEQKYTFKMPAMNMTLEAYADTGSYHIYFDPNGGKCDTDELKVEYGTAYYSELPDATRKGYTFVGWSTSPEGKDIIGVGAVMDKNSDMTLYAVWSQNSITITFNKSSGSNGTASVTAMPGGALPSITVPTRENYVFDGYYEGRNGSGFRYYDEKGAGIGTVDFTSDTTLYANWNAKTAKVTYWEMVSGTSKEMTPGEGSLPYTVPREFSYGDRSVELPAIRKDGATFGGWYASGTYDGTPITYLDDDLIINNEIRVYVKWVVDSATITLNPVYGNGGTATIEYTAGMTLSQITTPTRENYTFGGYYTKKNGSGTCYFNEKGEPVGKPTFTEDTTLYAYWIPKTVKLTYWEMVNGAAKEMVPGESAVPYTAPRTFAYGDEITPPSIAKDGYVFIGWYTNNQFTGSKVTAVDEDMIINNEIRLFAKWGTTIMHATIHMEGGTTVANGENAIVLDIAYNETLPTWLDEIPTREGYKFKGFFTKQNGRGEEIYNSNGELEASGMKLTSDLTIYASWEELPPPETEETPETPADPSTPPATETP